jgi:hypothetical protein
LLNNFSNFHANHLSESAANAEQMALEIAPMKPAAMNCHNSMLLLQDSNSATTKKPMNAQAWSNFCERHTVCEIR